MQEKQKEREREGKRSPSPSLFSFSSFSLDEKSLPTWLDSRTKNKQTKKAFFFSPPRPARGRPPVT